MLFVASSNIEWFNHEIKLDFKSYTYFKEKIKLTSVDRLYYPVPSHLWRVNT